MIAVVVHGPPGPAKVNTRAAPTIRRGRPSMRPENAYERWRAKAIAAVRAAIPLPAEPLAGPLQAEIRAYWPRTHRQGPAEGLAVGDVDAVIKAVLDAIQHSGAVADDAQFVLVEARKFSDSKFPRIEFEFGKETT